jgi:hypothetical protein
LKHIFFYFAPPTRKTDTPDPGKDPGPRKIGAFSQSFDDFVPILGNDGKKFWIIGALKLIFSW